MLDRTERFYKNIRILHHPLSVHISRQHSPRRSATCHLGQLAADIAILVRGVLSPTYTCMCVQWKIGHRGYITDHPWPLQLEGSKTGK
jgi:hypothetical protein